MVAPPQRASRLARELELLARDPPFGVSCWPDTARADLLHAQIVGLAGTPYERGVFRLEVVVPERYPFEPPAVHFATPIHHPNVDTAGRICLDVLKMPPKGSWKPALNVGTVLTSIQQLMAEPNPDDALMSDIAAQFMYRRAEYDSAARAATLRHALDALGNAAVEGDAGADTVEADSTPRPPSAPLPTKRAAPPEDDAAEKENVANAVPRRRLL